jgi:hypothetical protein
MTTVEIHFEELGAEGERKSIVKTPWEAGPETHTGIIKNC